MKAVELKLPTFDREVHLKVVGGGPLIVAQIATEEWTTKPPADFTQREAADYCGVSPRTFRRRGPKPNAFGRYSVSALNKLRGIL